MPVQSKQLLVARDEQVGLAAGRQFQKLLIVCVPASGKGGSALVNGVVPYDEVKVSVQ